MADSPSQGGISYRDAGVDIDAGNELVDRIGPLAQSTTRPGVLSGLGGFGALFEVPVHRYREPVLVSGTDGVGTKLKLAQQLNRHATIGIDLVAMCVNDILVSGAEPLYFLDYFACGKLQVDTAESVVAGIAEGCRQAGCALAGGETAEMPGFYQPGEYDLAGFAVGVAEKSRLLTPKRVGVGDQLVALASSGAHSNGYSLIRKILEADGGDLERPLGEVSLGDALLAPTRIYVKSLLQLLAADLAHGFAHITGGGLTENLPRVLPPGCMAEIDKASWQWPEVFRWIQAGGRVAEEEMLRTFNCGVGMIAVVSADDLDAALGMLREQGEQAWHIGRVGAAEPGVRPWVRFLS